MSVAWKRWTVYVRGGLVVAAVLAIGLVLFQNRANKVAFWFFGLTDDARPVNVVWLMLGTASGTLFVWRVLRFGRGLWRDARELKRLDEAKRKNAELDRRRADLEERERRIDDKVKRAVADRQDHGE